jgi:hypothetical protein
MRLTAAILFGTALMACSSTGSSHVQASASPVAVTVHPTSSECPLGNAISVDISLGTADNGRSIRTHLCAVIAVRLQGASPDRFIAVQSSDAAVLTILPLPLPAGDEWFQAKSTGSADLYGVPPSTWRVHVLVDA